MDSSASDSTKEIGCTTYFSKLSVKKEKKLIIVPVNILLHICFTTFRIAADTSAADSTWEVA